jgi:hypothetical protein
VSDGGDMDERRERSAWVTPVTDVEPSAEPTFNATGAENDDLDHELACQALERREQRGVRVARDRARRGASGAESRPGKGSVIDTSQDVGGAEEEQRGAALLAVLVALLDADRYWRTSDNGWCRMG